ncbi:hypothetical protein [Aquabacter cavernae]|uniref:hypothetical protein n=1 Tax=Aquabacter cavernae TaxID=2496029 RepID=UPI00196ACE28|nr:hypothetical protein [Aquabacter cavernae]
MADHPILMSAPMVRAILREIEQPGTGKTQTRRLITPHNFKLLGHDFRFHRPDTDTLASALNGARDFRWIEGAFSWLAEPGGINSMAVAVQGRGRPAIAPGDRLFIRETWAVSTIYDNVKPRDINPDGKPDWCGIRYGATDERRGIKDRVSIHMPRWASRLTLYVTEVRVERLQDISEADAWAEGCMRGLRDDVGGFFPAEEPDPSGIGQRGWDCARDWYADLWDSINGADAWDANPWVFAYSFVPYPENIDNLPTTLPVAA